MRAQRGSEQVIGVRDVGDPVAHRFVDGVLQRATTGIHTVNGRAQQVHAHDIQRLATHVLGPHVDAAFEAEQCTGCRGCDAVLASACFRHDTALAHPSGRRRLAEGVVDLVRAGVREIFALEEDTNVWRVQKDPPYPTRLTRLTRPGEVPGLVQRRGPTDVMLQQPVELFAERLVLACGVVAGRQLFDRRDERLGHEPAAVCPEITASIRIASSEHRPIDRRCLGRLHQRYSSKARRAFEMNCATLSKSFTPGADSTPDDTSTPNGCTARMAVATLSGVRPPASTTLRVFAIPAARVQSTALPVPPRRTGSMLSTSSAVSGDHASAARLISPTDTARLTGRASASA